jgi:hypothetical protein
MFGERLLRARSQIVFILALIVSLGIIVWIELSQTGDSALDARSDASLDSLRQLADDAVANARSAINDDGEMDAASLAAGMLAIASAANLGALPESEAIELSHQIIGLLSPEALAENQILRQAALTLASAVPSLYPEMRALLMAPE